jgi:hypothetical protein
MGAGDGMAQHGEAALAGMAPPPLTQGLLGEIADEPAAGPPEPVEHPRLGAVFHRHVEQPDLLRRPVARHRGSAPRLEIRRARQVETVEPGQRGLHLLGILDLVDDRLGVLLLERL